MMSYKIRASGTSHQFGNLSTICEASPFNWTEKVSQCYRTALYFNSCFIWNPVLRTTLKILLIYFPLFSFESSPELSLWNTDLTIFSVYGYRSFCPTACILRLILTYHGSFIFESRLSQIVLNYSPVTNFLFHFLLFSLILYCSICQRWIHWFYYRNMACISAYVENSFITVWQIVKYIDIYTYRRIHTVSVSTLKMS
jgi:hypothetical protein